VNIDIADLLKRADQKFGRDARDASEAADRAAEAACERARAAMKRMEHETAERMREFDRRMQALKDSR
jgi:hypothetical protein